MQYLQIDFRDFDSMMPEKCSKTKKGAMTQKSEHANYDVIMMSRSAPCHKTTESPH